MEDRESMTARPYPCQAGWHLLLCVVLARGPVRRVAAGANLLYWFSAAFCSPAGKGNCWYATGSYQTPERGTELIFAGGRGDYAPRNMAVEPVTERNLGTGYNDCTKHGENGQSVEPCARQLSIAGSELTL